MLRLTTSPPFIPPHHRSYYMLNDFNHHHHHAVLAGNTWRYSSTHRVAVTSKDTWDFAWHTSQEGKQAYEQLLHHVNAKTELDPAAMRKAAEAHLVVEFDWLRMYYIQGQKHADAHHAFWQSRMEQLFAVWSSFERALPIVAGYMLERGAKVTNQRSKRMYMWLLDELIEKRKEYKKRCRSSAYFALGKEERPLPLPESGSTVKASDLRAALV
jgi:alpha-ketoglutarate-dependent dioxygenase FTO